ncbi:hypothetical protein J7F03_13505 [Streptomyces sp. ISL-43]|uniref:hypothetical protein n=1 Tax=Streptomyces sp. ISL-43 TaxID=2819183 RepID=UPI001BE719C1|nr:hypothetical protein [Streptomyces sp. ISL-43]MBT2448077.1 hypothetical protein [Streptomyces sp. ISL-43]
MTLSALDLALVEEATKKSGLIWVRGTGADRGLWHAWVDGAAHVLGDGPGEQPFPGLADGAAAEVTVRSKDKGGRLVAWTATVRELVPESEPWQAAVAELKGKRLNAPDSERMTERWARECRLLRLEPLSVRDGLPEDSLAAAPLGSPATTRRPMPAGLPKLLFKRKKAAR